MEGILEQIYEELGQKAFVAGDSALSNEGSGLGEFLADLLKVCRPFYSFE